MSRTACLFVITEAGLRSISAIPLSSRVICASPAYLARCGTPQHPEDLKDYDGITFRGFPIAPEWRYRKDSPALAVEPPTRLAVNSTEAAVDASLAGLGIIRVLSYEVADELRSGSFAAPPGGVRAGADAGQPRLPARRFTAAEDESLPELDHAATPSACRRSDSARAEGRAVEY